MKPATLTALQGSIKKWEEIVAGTGEDNYADNCPLCQRFNDGEIDGGADCTKGKEKCPVYKNTSKDGCAGSPWMLWNDKYWDLHDKGLLKRRKATTPELVALAQAELDFLRSLLPETKS